MCARSWLRVLVTLLVVAGVSAQPPAPESVATAAARLQAHDPAGAAEILERVTGREPGNARAWQMLGSARKALQQLDAAVTAYTKALDAEPESPAALYGLAAVSALKHDPDAAFAWLRRAKATRRIDMTQIEFDGDLAALKHDPRFRALLPVAADFEHPLVEPATIVREWDGESPNDQFGWIARAVGDVDGDGVIDVVTSAPTRTAGDGKDAGRVYMFSTRSGRLLWSVDGHAGDELGTGVEGAGDTNGDGVSDVVASAPGSGRAYVYSGRDGRVLLTLSAEKRDDEFGRHVSGAGDVNGDGFADVLVGAPGHDGATGRAYLFSGKDGRVLLTLTGERGADRFGSAVAAQTVGGRTLLLVGAPGAGPSHHGRVYVYNRLSAVPQFTIDADDTGHALGAMFLSVVGDINRDGVADVYASDWSNGAKGPSTGRIYVHSGRDGKRLLTLTGETVGEGFGIGPGAAGDVDGDGYADLIVGSWQYAGAALSGGRAYLYSGKDGRLMKTFTCRIPGDTFGFDAVGLGDVDGDGTIDFLITSAWSGIHGFHSGRMFVISSGIRPAASTASARTRGGTRR